MKYIHNFSEFTERIPKEYEDAWGIYFILDTDDEIIYIGQSMNIKKRANKYWKRVSCNKIIVDFVLGVETRQDLIDLETDFIWKYRPKHNRNHQHGKKHVSYYA